jgi:hypothetical protein
LGLSLIGAIAILLATGSNKKRKQFDSRITLGRRDKIPYGAAVAYTNLGHLFPDASVYVERHEPGYWDSISNYDSNQAFIAITGSFSADESEMRRLITFAESGNDVFVSARYVSAVADEMLQCSSSSLDMFLFSADQMADSLQIYLDDPPFGKQTKFGYPGKKFDSYFEKIDSNTVDVLGHDERGHPNFIHLRAGKGNFYLQLEPLAFTNYFLLYKDNIHYYENALSVLRPGIKKIVWDEYYLHKKGYGNEKKPNWLSVLFKFPALKAALLIAIFSVLLYVLLEMRRKQRFIPVISKPRNDSLDFVKTIGRLYFDKGDHKNLSSKMAAYFLEHVRNRYKLATNNLNDEFIKSLQFKTGCDEAEIRSIVSFIRYLDEVSVINQTELTNFHKHLESFYKKA